mgnify:CR=1
MSNTYIQTISTRLKQLRHWHHVYIGNISNITADAHGDRPAVSHQAYNNYRDNYKSSYLQLKIY